MKGKKVLVAGGAGFIGSHLVDALLARGCVVRVADNLSRGQLQNLEHCLDRVEFLKGDLSLDATSVEGVDVVFDLAAAVFGARHLYKLSGSLLAGNMETTMNLVDAAVDSHVEKYIYVSSSCVYDFEGVSLPHREEDIEPMVRGGLPQTYYGMSKIVGEYLLKGYRAEFDLDYCVARIFNAYGTRESPLSPHVIPDFFRKAHYLKAHPEAEQVFELIGDGSQTRAFTWVGDIVVGLLLMAEKDEAVGEAFNIGTDEEITMQVLAMLISKIYNINPTFKYTEGPKGDIQRRSADVSKAKRILGWEPRISLDEGLRMEYEWIDPLIENLKWRL